MRHVKFKLLFDDLEAMIDYRDMDWPGKTKYHLAMTVKTLRQGLEMVEAVEMKQKLVG